MIYLLTVARKRKAISRILVIQTAKIGDLICSTPVFREIKGGYPDAHLTVMATPLTAELLENNPRVDKVLPLTISDYKGITGKIKLAGLVRRGNYDVAICLNPNVLFALTLFWGLVPVRLSVMPNFSGTTFRCASVFFTFLERHIRGRMTVETYLKMLKAIGIESSDISKEVYASKQAGRKTQDILQSAAGPIVGIAVSSGNRMKEWGTEKIARLINMLLSAVNIHIMLIGSDQDKNSAGIISGLVTNKDKVTDVTGKLNLRDLPALIGRLSLFIGVDTGITYMADALGIPVIDIAGPSDMKDQRPTGRTVVIIQKNDMACVPCSHTFKAPYSCRDGHIKCITEISVDKVFEEAIRLLGQN